MKKQIVQPAIVQSTSVVEVLNLEIICSVKSVLYVVSMHNWRASRVFWMHWTWFFYFINLKSSGGKSVFSWFMILHNCTNFSAWRYNQPVMLWVCYPSCQVVSSIVVYCIMTRANNLSWSKYSTVKISTESTYLSSFVCVGHVL